MILILIPIIFPITILFYYVRQKELFVLLKTISTQAEQRHMTFLSIMSYAKPAVKKCLIRFILIANHLIKEESIGMLTSSLPIQQMADGIKNVAAAIMNLIHLQFPKKAIRLLLKAMTSLKPHLQKAESNGLL